MDFDEYRCNHFRKAQKNISYICLFGTIFSFVVEMCIFYIFLKYNLLKRTPLNYFLRSVGTPTFVNTISTIFAMYFSSSNYSEKVRNYVVSISVLVCCSNIAIAHIYFSTLMFSLCFPIFICVIFADKKLLRIVALFDSVSFLIVGHVYFMAFKNLSMGQRFSSFICLFSLLFLSYVIASRIVASQAKQIEFIYEQYKKQASLIEELKIEPMTQLYNKTALEGCMNAYIRKYYDGDFKPSIAIFDIDHFKLVNDNYGHSNGDKVLLKLAEIIKNRMGGIRHAFRFGGEEFVLAFENESIEEIKIIVEQIRSDFKNTEFDFDKEKRFSFSAGISSLSFGWDKNTWFDSADKALYKAKENGRDRVEVAN